MVKAPGGQRESEGVVVPLIGVHDNAPGGKGPHFDHASGEGKHQGMTGASRSDYPGGREPAVAGLVPPPVPGVVRADPVNVRGLQRKLWAAARQSAERRFDALDDRVHRGDVLWEAWHRMRLREQKRIVRYYLRRWPSQRSVKRLREKVHARTGRNRAGAGIREVIAELNPLLRGWGNYFRTGNAATKFTQADSYVVWRLRSLMVRKRGRNLHAGQTDAWTEDWFNGHGLYRLRGTIRYQGTA